MGQTYSEREPVAALRDAVRTVWAQQIEEAPHVQRHLPTGGVELHCRAGSLPRVIGPLSEPLVEVLPAGETVVGVRFLPGMAAPWLGLPVSELVDQTVELDELWGRRDAVELAHRIADAPSMDAGALVVQRELVRRRAWCEEPDALVARAVQLLMPWEPGDVRTFGAQLAISPSQLRRRCLAAVGVGPKTLQRTLRFQGFVALVQAGAGSLSELSAECGYADQAHMSREVRRLSGLQPGAFLGDVAGRFVPSDHANVQRGGSDAGVAGLRAGLCTARGPVRLRAAARSGAVPVRS